MKKWFCVLMILFMAGTARADQYILDGGQESTVRFSMTQNVNPPPGCRKLVLKYVTPENFSSPTYEQDIQDVVYRFLPAPSSREMKQDAAGNRYMEASWESPRSQIRVNTEYEVHNRVRLEELESEAPFPLRSVPKEVLPYTRKSKQVQSDNPQIQKKARELTGGAQTQHEAVESILSWVADHMKYVLKPPRYDAYHALTTGQGNCQNYAHLSCALLRSQGIPARVVTGVTLKEPYKVISDRAIITLRMAQGRHAWIEVWFSDLGWMPFDPQKTQLFVSNRFIRMEAGPDNSSAQNDGQLLWVRAAGSGGRPVYRETIASEFTNDQVKLAAKNTGTGPRAMVMAPRVGPAYQSMQVPAAAASGVMMSAAPVEAAGVAGDAFERGNLEFPRGVDFSADTRQVEQEADGSFSMKRSYMVETAEYVTTQGRQYAQMFELKEPVRLSSIDLALHSFGGSGQLWVELTRDAGMVPGEQVATSQMVDLADLGHMQGYDWVDFSFDEDLVLASGKYWIGLAYTGAPIVNWFFSYGKPTSPLEGTRYREVFDDSWSRALANEFNYRVRGTVAR